MKFIISIFLFVFSISSTHSVRLQDSLPIYNWVLKKKIDDMLVYTRDIANTNLKELKIVVTLENTYLSQVLTVLGDTEFYPDWVYGCSGAKEIKRQNDLESYDYYQMDFPWPLSDRELYTFGIYTQDPTTKILTIITTSDQKYAKPKSSFVNITNHYNKWILEPLNNKQVKVTYLLKSYPGGNIPNWLINMAIDYGPRKTMNGLKKRLKNKKYANVKLGWVMD